MTMSDQFSERRKERIHEFGKELGAWVLSTGFTPDECVLLFSLFTKADRIQNVFVAKERVQSWLEKGFLSRDDRVLCLEIAEQGVSEFHASAARASQTQGDVEEPSSMMRETPTIPPQILDYDTPPFTTNTGEEKQR